MYIGEIKTSRESVDVLKLKEVGNKIVLVLDDDGKEVVMGTFSSSGGKLHFLVESGDLVIHPNGGVQA